MKIIYEKGGGKRPAHNYVQSCSDISKLSRLVILQYIIYADGLLSPLPSQQGPVYLFLHQEHLITSLDALCGTGVGGPNFKFPLQPALEMLTPNAQLLDMMNKLNSVSISVLNAVETLVKEAASRNKRSTADDLEIGSNTTDVAGEGQERVKRQRNA